MTRRDDLAQGLALTQAQIAAACTDRDLPTLIVVTKTWPAADVRILASLGVTDVGENRDQEASAKRQECADLGVRWHCIGQLQTNKAKSVAQWADAVHSVDRPELVAALGSALARNPRETPLDALIQVSLDLDYQPGRGGAPAADVPGLADQVASTPGLRLAGVMGVAPLGEDPRPAFERLAGVAMGLQTQYPQANWVSAGMSQDFEAALEFGATHLRIGSTILGHRAVRG